MLRTMLTCLAATAAAGCETAAPQPQPDVIVYIPPKDPAYAIPERFRERAKRQGRVDTAGFQREALTLHERVRRDPAFGGLVVRWTPAPHAVVMFTGDAESRLRRYTADPRFRAQRVELTLAQLERMKDRFGAQLSRLGLRCFSVDGHEEHNAVTVGAPAAELAKVRAAIASGAVRPPPKLRLVEQGCAEFR